MAGGWHENTAVVDRNIMLPGDTLDGPCVIREDTATTVVEPGWQAVAAIQDRVAQMIDQLAVVIGPGTDAAHIGIGLEHAAGADRLVHPHGG